MSKQIENRISLFPRLIKSNQAEPKLKAKSVNWNDENRYT